MCLGKLRLTIVLNNSTSTTLDSEDTSELEDDVLGGGPAVKSTGELDTDDLGGLKLPGEVGHDIDGIGTTDTNGGHTETGSVGSVGVSADEETTGESVVLEDDLVDDTRAGLPETNVVLGAGGGKEVVDLLVDVDSALEILLTTNLGLNQVVAVDGGGVGNGGHASRHELEDGHLGGGILAGNTIGAETEVGDTALDVLLVGVVQVRVEDLLSVGEGAVETAADNGEVLGHLLVVDEVALLKKVLLDLFSTWHVSALLRLLATLLRLLQSAPSPKTYLAVERVLGGGSHAPAAEASGGTAPGNAQELTGGQHYDFSSREQGMNNKQEGRGGQKDKLREEKKNGKTGSPN